MHPNSKLQQIIADNFMKACIYCPVNANGTPDLIT